MIVPRALIIFAKLPRPGAVKTRLGASVGIGAASKVYAEIAEHAFSVGERLAATGMDVYIFYEPAANEEEIRFWIKRPFTFMPQHGQTLGDRMQHGFEHTFSSGAARTVIIGSDIPELSVHTIELAFAALDRYDVVLGPAADGGYYLLGMSAPVKELFGGIPWSTSAVLEKTLQKLREFSLTWSLLPVLSDIDTEEDYHAYLLRKDAK